MHDHVKVESRNAKKLFLLSLGALGVVYGDIGTSPLYAVNEMFFGHHHLDFAKGTILGCISLVFWALTIIVSFKYVVYVLKADNDGEGGVFALAGLLRKKQLRNFRFIIPLLIFGAGLLYGDGVITPAISVLSSVEGLRVATPAFEPFIVPITIGILTGLFYIQRKGTTKIGTIFGPIVLIWFASISLLGIRQIVQHPEVLFAINPYYAFHFVISHNIFQVFLTLGSVMLVVTGGEAMYADMGHFGRAPIRISWFTAVYPALLLSYFGQGAYLISGARILSNNIFFSMTPTWALYPMVVLATLATIIASQALISGAFSLTTQAIQLRLLPYLKTIQTHEDHEGQRYISVVNWLLYIGCVVLVLTFKSSTNLASAYGLAVSGVMLITSMAMFGISRYYWKWSKLRCALIFTPLALIDSTFLVANSLKFFQGGYIPVLVGFILMSIMLIWQWGRRYVRHGFKSYPSMSVKELINIKKKYKNAIPRSMIFLTPDAINTEDDKVPMLKQLFWDRYRLLPQHLIFLTVKYERIPYVHNGRHSVIKFFDDAEKGTVISIKLRFGFMEEPLIEEELDDLIKHKDLNMTANHSQWLIHALRERFIPSKRMLFIDKIRFSIFEIMCRMSLTADEYFGLGNKESLTLEVFPIKL